MLYNGLHSPDLPHSPAGSVNVKSECVLSTGTQCFSSEKKEKKKAEDGGKKAVVLSELKRHLDCVGKYSKAHLLQLGARAGGYQSIRCDAHLSHFSRKAGKTVSCSDCSKKIELKMLRNLIHQSIQLMKKKVNEYNHFSGNSFFFHCIIRPSTEILYISDQEL